MTGYEAAYTNTQIRRADWESDREVLMMIRRKVFIEEQQVPEHLEWEAQDSGAEHVLAWRHSVGAIGCGRLLGSGQIGRMAVLSAYRQSGVGHALLHTLLDLAQQRGHTKVFLHAQISAQGFYRKAGFLAYGEVFTEAGIPHICMRKPVLY